ncbi:acyl-CoA dehydrogenase family protein [Streptomyces sp. KL116D]|uniref:acyl-CoA dehydrogenase family protein n=1 Tax=Streptomyces sp. KL116D TaxID=3045152 RepID=UPI003557A7EB
MDFTLTQEQEDLAATVRHFAEKELAAGALERAHNPTYSWDVAERLASMNLLGLAFPEVDGGAGGSLMDAVVAIQALASVCPTAADVFQAGNFGAIRTLAEYASPEQKKRFLPDLLAGRALISVAMSESEAGSALTDLSTSAVPDGDEYVINGTKLWSTHSPDATLFLVYVRYGPGVGGIGSVLVERDTPGLTVGAPESYMSGEHWSELRFENCRIPTDNVLLGPGGFKKQISGFNVERIGNSARALAVGRHAFNIARDHANVREQFGRPLSDFQGIQWKFAEIAVQMESAQLLLYRAAVSADRGLPSAYDTAVAKYACNTAGFAAANEAVQVMGAMGYSTQTLVEYCLRRTRGWQIAGGSLEILRNRIAEDVFGRRFSQRAPK